MGKQYNNGLLVPMKGATLEACRVTFGASGAPTLVDRGRSGAFVSVAKTATGRYTFTLAVPYPASLIDILPKLSCVSASGAVQHARYVEGSYDATAGTFEVDVTSSAGTSTGSAPVAASGTITLDAKTNLGTADTITIGDGLTPAKVYELDKAGDGVAGSNIQVNVSTDTTAAQVAARLRTAILANQPALSVTDNADGTLSLSHKWPGAGGNVAMSKSSSSAIAVVGLASGADASVGSVTAAAAANPTSGTALDVTVCFQRLTNI